jgi:hypothetical protein
MPRRKDSRIPQKQHGRRLSHEGERHSPAQPSLVLARLVAPRARRDGMRLREYLGFEMGLGRQPVGYRQGIARTAFTPYFPTLAHLLLLHLSLDTEMASLYCW